MHIEKKYIEGIKRNEPRAQKEIYTQLLPYLNAICGRYLNELSFRQDVLQETFIKIFTKVNQFNPQKGKFQSWAAKILINACLQHNKKSEGKRTVEITEQIIQVSIRPEVLAALRDEDVLKFLQTMPSNYYTVFNLFIVDGYAHQEIAKLLDINESLSRQWLSRAKSWLKKHIDFDSGVFSYDNYSNN